MINSPKQLTKLLARAEKKLKKTMFEDLDIHSNERGEVHSVSFIWKDRRTHHNYRFYYSKGKSNQESLSFDILDEDGHLAFCGAGADKYYVSFLRNIRDFLQRKISEESEREQTSFGYHSRRMIKLARFYNK